MIEYGGGWLFVGRDGELLRATFDLEGEWHMAEEYPLRNGWVVGLYHLEWWDGLWPEPRD